MRPTLPKPSLWAQKLRHTFHQFLIAKPINKSLKGIVNKSLLWLLSETCQTSVSAWLVFKWLHLAWTDRQLTENCYTTG